MSVGTIIILVALAVALLVGLFSMLTNPVEVDTEEEAAVEEAERRSKRRWWQRR